MRVNHKDEINLEKEFSFFYNIYSRKTYLGLFLHLIILFVIPTILSIAFFAIIIDGMFLVYHIYVLQDGLLDHRLWSQTNRMFIMMSVIFYTLYKSKVNGIAYKKKYPIDDAECFK